MTSPTTPAGATEQDWVDEVGLNVKLDYDGQKWQLSEDTKADIRAHEASAVLDGKIEELQDVRDLDLSVTTHNKIIDRLATLTKQKAAMQQEEK